MRKNRLLLVILVLLVSSLVFAAAGDYDPETEVTYVQAGEAFQGTSTRILGMGGAGLAVRGYYDSFLVNPANLAKAGFKFSLPAVTVTLYNPKAILESTMIDDIEDDDMPGAATAFLNTIRMGYGDVVTTDVSTSLSLGSFALALEVQERLMSYQTGSESDTLNLIAQVTAAATAGLGFRIDIVPDSISIDLGISAKVVYKAYLEAVTGKTLVDMFVNKTDPSALFLNQTPLIAGYALPVSAGVNVNLPVGLTISAAAKNINGNYTMNTYNSVNDWAEELIGERFTEDVDGTATSTVEPEWTLETPWRLDAGLAWAPRFGSLIRPTLAIDVVDVMAMADLKGEDLKRAFYDQTRLGASIRLLSILDVRAGLNKGYKSIGVGFDLLIFHIDAAYYTLEYGSSISDKPIDAVSLRFSLFSR